MNRPIAAALLLILSAVARAGAASFYVDADEGNDANAGTQTAPWKSVDAVNTHAFAPGDVISFKAGETFTGALVVSSSGTSDAPIRVTAYGGGAPPELRNPGALYAVRIAGSHIAVVGLAFADTATMAQWSSTGYEDSGAILITEGSDDVLVSDCDFTRVGVGIKSYGLHTVIQNNTFHDLVIAYHDANLSYGAIGVSIDNSDATIAGNTFIDCRSTESPYGADGGAIEIEGYRNQAKDHISIHNNRSTRSQGFLEVTETTSSDVHIFENVSDDYQQFIAFDTTVTPSRYVVDHNTIVRSYRPNATNVFAIFYYRETGPEPNDSWLTFTDNIFYTPMCKVLRGTYTFKPYDFPHSGNVFYDGGPDPLGYPLGPGDVVADPRFVDFFARDFRLSAGSPAAGKGADYSRSGARAAAADH